MSMVLTGHSGSNRSGSNRVFYAHLFARLVRGRRREVGLGVDQAAELAGITSSQWISIEAGWVPRDYKMIRAISATLQVRDTELQVASILSFLSLEETAQ